MKTEAEWKSIGENFPDLIYAKWLKLLFYFEHELLEEEITNQTYKDMTECLMALKIYLPDTKA